MSARTEGEGAAIVEAAGLWKYFGQRAAVADVTFSVPSGQCFGLLGPNGAGKTTIIKMITCLAQPSRGTLRVFGLPMAPARDTPIAAQEASTRLHSVWP